MILLTLKRKTSVNIFIHRERKSEHNVFPVLLAEVKQSAQIVSDVLYAVLLEILRFTFNRRD